MVQNKKIEVRKRYNASASHYDTRYKKIQFTKYEEVFSKIDVSKLKTPILDVGGGTGLLVEYLGNNAKEVWCIDISLSMLKIAKQKRPRGYYVCADGDYLPLRSHSVKTVVSFTMLQNLPEPDKTLAEITRVLEQNGVVFLTSLAKTIDLTKLIEWTKKYLKIEKAWNVQTEDIAIIAKKK